MLLPNTDVTHAVTIADKVRRAICDLEIEHSGGPSGFVTISAGVAAREPTQQASEPVQLIMAADKALYEAKNKGRNRVLAVRGNLSSSAPA